MQSAADPAAVADHGAGVERRAVADDGLVADVGERIDGDVLADRGGRGDPGLGMHARPARLLLAREVGADGEERRDRVVDLDDRQVVLDRRRRCVEVRADDRGRGRRGPEQLGVPLVLDEGDVAGPGLADRPGRVDRDVAVARRDDRGPGPRAVRPLRPRAISFLP